MVLQQNIISKPLNSSLNDYLLDFFSHTNLTSVIEEGAWVAGGFARLVALDEFNIIPNTDHKKILEYIYGFGDIDIFSSSLSQINKAYMRFARGDRYTEAKKVAQNNYFNLNYESCFSNNINFPGKKEFDVNFDISERLREYTNKYSHIKLQFVNKFFYNNIEETFENFDFTNCKYALTFSDGKFILHYDKSALEFDKKSELNLEHCRSPLLGSRIIKYLSGKKYITHIHNSKRNKDIIKDFCLKVSTNTWDSLYENNFYNTLDAENLRIPCLHQLITLDKEDLILFLGKVTHTKTVYTGGYGVYNYASTEKYDWALNEINFNIVRNNSIV
tara:strand:- start:1974 stop:2966 length:993 start_codon:yes stop_codon:yes gene_type:complete